MNQDEILEEIKKCKDSPYYFAIQYLKVKNHKNKLVEFKTPLNEDEFNAMFNNYEDNIKV